MLSIPINNNSSNKAIAANIEIVVKHLFDNGGRKLLSGITDFQIDGIGINPAPVSIRGSKICVNAQMMTDQRKLPFLLIQAMGKFAFERSLSNLDRIQWASKLTVVPHQLAKKIEGLFAEKESFDEVLQAVDGAVDKLVCIHIINALVIGNIRFETLKTTKLENLPQVSGFASGCIPFSLVPLLSVYADQSINDFGTACAFLFTSGLPINELSTLQATENLVRSFLL